MNKKSFFDPDVPKNRIEAVRLGFLIAVLTGILTTSLIIRFI
jgi:hypothetical protein